MDKLADKISAAEMIKANAAAEAAETQRLRTQALQYQEEMEAIHKTADELTALMNKISSKLDDNSKDTDNAENKKLLENTFSIFFFFLLFFFFFQTFLS